MNTRGRIGVLPDGVLETAESYLDSFDYTRIDKEFQQVPTAGGLALAVGYSRQSLYKWAQKFDEFSEIMDRLMAIQEEMLVQGALNKNFGERTASLMLMRHGYTQKEEHTVEGGENPVKHTVEFIGGNPSAT